MGRFHFFLAGILVVMISMGLNGCMVGPNYQKPKPPVPVQFSEVLEGTATTDKPQLELARWWTIFEDQELNSLVDRAVQTNKNLKLAEARIREARAQRSFVAAGAYPEVNTSAQYALTDQLGKDKQEHLFQVGFDSSWELDLFGRVQRSVEAATAQIQATEESRRDVLVTLLSELARNYIETRGGQLRLAIAKQNIDAQRQTVELTRARFEAGLGSELAVAQAKAQLAATESQVPVLETSIKLAIHRIGVLLGQEPGLLVEELSKEAPLPSSPPDVPVGLPSDLLRRRPDVRQAERELAASTAEIGVATADLFPRISLTGIVNWQGGSASDLVTPENRFLSIGPTISWPVFDAGRIRANINVRNAKQEQSLVRYEQSVLRALEDVENALVAYSKELVRRKSLVESVEANLRAFDISHELYSKGLIDFLNVLISQRALFLAQDELALSSQGVSTNLVALFKALGGGWEVAPGESIGNSVDRVSGVSNVVPQ
ncbi:MAG: efflux transporter outer membrane subunit [Syntrophobacteraceae bacterium]